MTASTATATATDVDVVRALFGAFASGTPTRPGTTTTTTASAGSTAAPTRSSPT
jgi:hypothetical protein